MLNKHVVAKVASELAPRSGFRLTQKSLGKVVPVVGIVIGGTLNWSALEGIVDAAEMAYRRRFLLDKHPHLAAGEPIELIAATTAPAEGDEAISVVDLIQEEIGEGT